MNPTKLKLIIESIASSGPPDDGGMEEAGRYLRRWSPEREEAMKSGEGTNPAEHRNRRLRRILAKVTGKASDTGEALGKSVRAYGENEGNELALAHGEYMLKKSDILHGQAKRLAKLALSLHPDDPMRGAMIKGLKISANDFENAYERARHRGGLLGD